MRGFLNGRFGAVCVSAALAFAATVQSAFGAGDVVISQVWGVGMGVPSGLPQASYVELYNRTSSPVDVTGWTVQIASATGTSWSSLELAAVIQPNSYYLVRTSSGSLLIAADAVFSPTSNILGATGGPAGNKVALMNTNAVLTVSCPTGDPALMDMVGLGASANCFEAARAPGFSTTGAGAAPTRNLGGCVDTDNNQSDFTALPPNPRSSGSAGNTCVASGACCASLTGVCTVDSSSGCAAGGGVFSGNGTTCSPSPCPAIGRCCTALPGLCYTVTQAGCNTVNGGMWTAGVTCSAVPQVCGFTDFPITTTACCFADGTCCQIDARVASCTSMGGTAPGGGACNPTTGFVCSTSPPSNDLCAGAVALTLNVPRVGSTARALTNDQVQNLCNNVSFSTKGVWFTFVPAASGVFDVKTCGSLFDSELQVLTVGTCLDPASWSYVACSQDGCTAGFPETGACGSAGLSINARVTGVGMTAGQTYYILVTGPGSSSGTGSSGNYKVVVTQTSTGTFGACCNSITGLCELRTQAACEGAAQSSQYQGNGSVCMPLMCDIGAGACCNFGGCTLRSASFCATIGGTFMGGTCLPTPCVTGACCSQFGSCLASLSEFQCQINNGTYLGNNSTCVSVSCPQPGACCYSSGLCSFITETACVSPWPSPISSAGTFQGVGIACLPNPCTPPAGVCCRGATCATGVASGDCTGANSAFVSTAACNATVQATTPCCHADFNKIGGVTVQDIFDFLSAWFGANPIANITSNGSGAPTVQSIFDFLTVWFTGCP